MTLNAKKLRVHIVLTRAQYESLRKEAAKRDEPISRIIRERIDRPTAKGA